jgi:hypothetical protein
MILASQVLVWGLVATVLSPQSSSDGRLFGQVITRDGQAVEGYIRWEGAGAVSKDILDGRRPRPQPYLQEAERLDPDYARRMRDQRTIEAFGVRIVWDVDDGDHGPTTRWAVRFEHLRAITLDSTSGAVVQLVDGTQVALRDDEGDLGRHRLAQVEFYDPPAGAAARTDARLRATVELDDGRAFAGLLTWPSGGLMTTDSLSVRDEDAQRRIPFRAVNVVEVLADGSVRLAATGDGVSRISRLGGSGRGPAAIAIVDDGLGRVTIPWQRVSRVTLDHRVPIQSQSVHHDRDAFRPIEGVVEARDGRRLQGRIRWDNDHEFGWETLEARMGDVVLDIDFSAITAVTRDGADGVRIDLVDGRVLDVDATADLGPENSGLFVREPGRPTRLVRWGDVSRVEFWP